MKKDNIVDNKQLQKDLVKKVYNNIFKLNTNLLQQHELAIFKELISRKDYNELDFLIQKYKIIGEELLSRGVDLS